MSNAAQLDFLSVIDDLTTQPATEREQNIQRCNARAQLYELMGECAQTNIIKTAFEQMKDAEEVIAQLKQEFPAAAAEIDACFVQLMPPKIFRDYGSQIYRAYCREVITQLVFEKKKKRSMTSAEVCIVMSEISLKAPLNGDATAMYYKHFRAALGQDVAEKACGALAQHARESYAGAVAELEYILFRKYEQYIERVQQ